MENRYHHGDLKVQLIKSGLRMIQEDGIKKLSLRRLAQMCNVSEAAPYSHFKNKDELLIAIQDYVTEQLSTCLQDAYEKSEQPDSPMAIFNMGKAYVHFFMEYPEYYSFLFAQLSQDFSYICFDFSVYYLSSVLWCKYDMVLAIPLRM